MSQPSVSIVIVSRGRPNLLRLCLTGVMRLHYAKYEIVVVADRAGVDMARSLPEADHLKIAHCPEANISVARNLGIGLAAGDIVAFVDDDAVPEPGWLAHLVRPFVDPSVGAAGGFVRGRNGISFQWRARSVDCAGWSHAMKVDSEQPSLPVAPPGHAVKTEGTNMAVRRDVVSALGGFDPAFQFYLDETDLNMRLAAAGYRTAIVPLAQVHHAYGPSARRQADRVVTDLSQIGASQMVFLRKHCPVEDHAEALKKFEQEQSIRVAAQKGSGGDDGGADLIAGLRAGFQMGRERALENPLPELSSGQQAFLPFESYATETARILAGRYWRKKVLHRQAAAAAKAGETVSLYVFSRTALFHTVRFHPNGYWVQRGGLFGRSQRNQPLFRILSFKRRLQEECVRVAAPRYQFPDPEGK